jgi:hypothetical protein
MTEAHERPYRNKVAVLTTMHGKEQVIGPVLKEGLGLIVGLAMGVNTDSFGTFSRDVERTGSQLDAARAKIAAGFEYAPLARIGLASEGSFGPHPFIPFLALGRELLVLIDRDTGLELTGHDAKPGTNYGHAIVNNLEDAVAFTKRARFPDHGLVVMGCDGEQPAPERVLIKDIVDQAALERAVRQAIDVCGSAFVEADMRAHRNPTRMAAIERAARDLVRRYMSRCPGCASPGFDVTERVSGLPCACCGEPTRVIQTEVLSCTQCAHRLERPATMETTADPGRCDGCNP